MEKAKIQLIKEAKGRFKKIYPCGVYYSFDKCFTVHKDRLVLWFNTEDHTTHAVQCYINT